MNDRFLPSQVAQVLRDENIDPDLHLSLRQVIATLPAEEQAFLSFYADGYAPYEAARQAGMAHKQPMRWFRSLILKLTQEMNR